MQQIINFKQEAVQLKTNFIGCLSRGGLKSDSIFLCQYETLPTTLLHLPTAQKSLSFFQLKYLPGMKSEKQSEEINDFQTASKCSRLHGNFHAGTNM